MVNRPYSSSINRIGNLQTLRYDVVFSTRMSQLKSRAGRLSKGQHWFVIVFYLKIWNGLGWAVLLASWGVSRTAINCELAPSNTVKTPKTY